MLEVKKQGVNDGGLWVIGTLDIGGLVIESIFNTNMRTLIEDTTKPIKVKKVKISNRYDSKTSTHSLRFSVEF